MDHLPQLRQALHPLIKYPYPVKDGDYEHEFLPFEEYAEQIG